MLELNASHFIGTTVELRVLRNLAADVPNANETISESDKQKLVEPHVKNLLVALQAVAAKSAYAPAMRLHQTLESKGGLTYKELATALNDIESRFADHLDYVKLFVLNEQEAELFYPAENVLNLDGKPIEGLRDAFPSAVFEVEEATKCLALDRYTASVFHCMRVMEVGIAALAKFLEVPNPIKATDRNWGTMLKAISNRIDEKWPKTNRFPGTIGSRMEALFVTLEAVKNPWRNATMHVETIYVRHEATHIARCTGYFLLELMKHCDENGSPFAPNSSPAIQTGP